jgi:hypothetical protein
VAAKFHRNGGETAKGTAWKASIPGESTPGVFQGMAALRFEWSKISCVNNEWYARDYGIS